MARLPVAILLAAAVSALAAARSFGCDSSACALLTRGRGGLLARHALQVDLSLRTTYDSTALEGRTVVADAQLPKVSIESSRIFPALHLAYGARERFTQGDVAFGLTSRVTVFASAPLDARRVHDVGHFGVRQRYETWGFGDLLVGARAATPVRGLVAGLAVKAPTGHDRLGGDYDAGILDPTFQPGSGSWDGVVSASYDGLPPMGSMRLSLAGSWQVNGTSSLRYRFGRIGVAALTASRPAGGRLSLSAQIKVFRQGRSAFLDLPVPSTGATMVYLSPGASVRLPARLSAYGYLQTVPFRDVNEQQLGPRLAFLVGVSRTFW